MATAVSRHDPSVYFTMSRTNSVRDFRTTQSSNAAAPVVVQRSGTVSVAFIAQSDDAPRSDQEECQGAEYDQHFAPHTGRGPSSAFVTRQRRRIARVISHDAVGVRDLAPGDYFPDLELSDTDGNLRRLSELAGPDPLLLHTYRGWFCPKERAFFRQLVALQDEAEVAYTRCGPAVERYAGAPWPDDGASTSGCRTGRRS